MSNHSGVVRKIFDNQFGTKKLYSFVLDSDKAFYNLGDKAPFFSEGASITFEGKPAKRAGNVDVLVETIKLVEEGKVETTMAGAKKTQVLQKDDYWKNREDNDKVTQKRIEIQAARNAAIALLQASGVTEQNPTTEDFVTYYTNLFIADNEARLNV